MSVKRLYIVWLNSITECVPKYCKYLGQIFCVCNFKWKRNFFQKAKYNIISCKYFFEGQKIQKDWTFYREKCRYKGIGMY